MNWHSLSDFLDMGGYGLYVWGSFGMTALSLAWEVLMVVQRQRRAFREAQARRLEEAEDDDTPPRNDRPAPPRP